jgi:phosphoribosylanthranilate isomerase
MTWVKICGMTNLEDALVAVDAGADAVGFVFYEKSPRCVSVETAQEICSKLPESIEKVGVFAGESADRGDEILRQVGLATAQVYPVSDGNPEGWPAWFRKSERKLIVAVPGDAVKDEFLITLGTTEKPFSAILVDSGSADQPGGTGQRFDWQGTKIGIWHLGTHVPVVIAGGLTVENVNEAIKTLRPWGVDVASGVEARPGKKDPEKVRAFVRAVREADRKIS